MGIDYEGCRQTLSEMKHLVTDKTRETPERKGIKRGLKIQVVCTCSVGQVKDIKLCAYVTRGQSMAW